MQLGANEIDPGHGLGDGMLHLEPRVHLEKVEARAVAVTLEQELDRSGVAIARRARGRDRRLPHSARERDGLSAGEGLSSRIF